ncbi:MAG: AlpA family phage regulatory protein [Alistipes senegalensis]|nr:AlpA family phage regulatory protein [Oxalobacter formigenes]MCM1281575.1 AlpA family phage regulatory protein [Alistipes senegalensis]
MNTQEANKTEASVGNQDIICIEGLIRLPEVMRLTGLKKSTLYGLMSPRHPSYDLSFPGRYQLSPGTVAWKKGEILQWCQNRPTKMS